MPKHSTIIDGEKKFRQFHDKRKTSAFRLFCSDLAKEAFEEFDSAKSVRFRITKGRAPKPAPGKKRWTTFDRMVQERIIKRGLKMNPWKRWVGWCTSTEAGTTLAAVRMAMGLLIFIDMVTLISSGIGFSLFSPLKDGGMAGNEPRNPIVEFLGGPSLSMTANLLWGGLCTSAALIAGLGGRLTSFLMLQILILLQSFSPDVCAGYDRLFTNALWLLVLGNPQQP